MSVDYFLLEGARVVPVEFQAWREASAVSHPATMAFLDGDRTLSEAEVTALNARTDALYAQARAAFFRKLREKTPSGVRYNMDGPEDFSAEKADLRRDARRDAGHDLDL